MCTIAYIRISIAPLFTHIIRNTLPQTSHSPSSLFLVHSLNDYYVHRILFPYYLCCGLSVRCLFGTNAFFTRFDTFCGNVCSQTNSSKYCYYLCSTEVVRILRFYMTRFHLHLHTRFVHMPFHRFSLFFSPCTPLALSLPLLPPQPSSSTSLSFV